MFNVVYIISQYFFLWNPNLTFKKGDFIGSRDSNSWGKDECRPSTDVIKTLTGYLDLLVLLPSFPSRFSLQGGKAGPWQIQGKCCSWSLKKKLSQRTFLVPEELGLVSLGPVPNRPIPVSREMRFSDWWLAPPLWWDSTLMNRLTSTIRRGKEWFPWERNWGNN